MNERIKNIAQESGFYFYDLHDVDGQDFGETIEADSWSAAEKFAQAIAKDIIDMIWKVGATPEMTTVIQRAYGLDK